MQQPIMSRSHRPYVIAWQAAVFVVASGALLDCDASGGKGGGEGAMLAVGRHWEYRLPFHARHSHTPVRTFVPLLRS